MTDYVFRDRGNGTLEFVGDFDGLYLNEADPWGQSGAEGRLAEYYRVSRQNLVDALKQLIASPAEGLEVGCGHGHVTALLANELPHIAWSGMDISQVAIEKATEAHPDIRFYCGDFANLNFGPRYADVIVLNQMLWYVLERLQDVMAHVWKTLPGGGLFIVSQAFLDEPQKYGANIINGFGGALTYFNSHYREHFGLVDYRHQKVEGSGRIDGLLIYRKK